VLLAVPVGVYFYIAWAGDTDLAMAIAETDQLDPHWRFDDLVAERAPISDEPNPALVAMKADALTRPSGFDLGRNSHVLFEDVPPQHRLNGPQIAALREALTKFEEAVKVARTLKDFPGEGRFPIRYDTDIFSINLEPLQRNRGVMYMLENDAMLRAEEEDAAGAMQSCRALLVTARSIGTEPFLIAMLIRVAGNQITVQTLERVLAQGEPPADELLALQELLAREMEAPLLAQAIRGERGSFDRFIAGMDSGNIRPSRLVTNINGGAANTVEGWLLDAFPAIVTRGRADYLRIMNKAVAASGLPPEKQAEAFAEIDRDVVTSRATVVKLLMPAVSKVSGANRRNQANLRCAVCGIAAERYRLKHDQWPGTLEDLVKDKLLAAVPTDPFDGRPLRLKLMPDGILIYSVGPDGVDNGGIMNRANPQQQGTDMGFRLWDVNARRQPPLPPPQLEELRGPP
jgi:hypothetical protein